MAIRPGDDSRWRLPILAALLLLTAVLGTRGLTDESAVMLGGDMARYVMNGVFLYDLTADGGAWSMDALARAAERYYARYPALSLGHHPPLPYFVLVPFFAAFGVSMFAAKLAALAWFLLAAWALYRLGNRFFGWQAASWATALFVSNVVVLRAGQYVLSEMPMLALILVSLNALFAYCDSGRTSHFVGFVIAVVASLFAKQFAVFMFPVYVVILITRLGWKALVDRRVVVAMTLGALLIVPLAIMTIGLAPHNLGLAVRQATRFLTGRRAASVSSVLTTIITTHLSWPALLATIAGATALFVRRNQQVITCMTWVFWVFAGTVLFAGGIESARYAFAALPAYSLLAAGLSAQARTMAARVAAIAILGGVLLWQGWLIRNIRPSGAGGYEAAAQYVVNQSAEPTVLFDSAVDTGYFVFFVRKHDPGQRLIVLRADKVWPGPPDRRAQVEVPADPESIYTPLRRYGIRFIVAEERTTGSPRLLALHQELKTGRFVERERIPIVNNVTRNKHLVIYEFLDSQPADLDAELDIGLPLGRRKIKLRLRDLVGPDER